MDRRSDDHQVTGSVTVTLRSARLSVRNAGQGYAARVASAAAAANPMPIHQCSTKPKQTVPLSTFSARRIKGMREERRLVWRVLRHWKEIADGGRFPRRDEIDPWLR